MRKYFLGLTMLLAVGCAHKPPVAPEPATPPKTLDAASGDPIEIEFLDTEASADVDLTNNSCKPEYLAYLLEYPATRVQANKEFYEAVLEVNKVMLQQAVLLYGLKLGKLDSETFVQGMASTKKILQQKTEDVNDYRNIISNVTFRTQMMYGECETALVKMLKSKRIDKNQDGCELQQVITYIEDPYSLQKILRNGLETEFKIQDHFSGMIEYLGKELDSNSTDAQTQSGFKAKMEALKSSGLIEQSVKEQEDIIAIFNATNSVQKKCEAGSAKK